MSRSNLHQPTFPLCTGTSEACQRRPSQADLLRTLYCSRRALLYFCTIAIQNLQELKQIRRTTHSMCSDQRCSNQLCHFDMNYTTRRFIRNFKQQFCHHLSGLRSKATTPTLNITADRLATTDTHEVQFTSCCYFSMVNNGTSHTFWLSQ